LEAGGAGGQAALHWIARLTGFVAGLSALEEAVMVRPEIPQSEQEVRANFNV
jgi:hypothetical protein